MELLPFFKQKPCYVTITATVHVGNPFANHFVDIRVVEELQ